MLNTIEELLIPQSIVPVFNLIMLVFIVRFILTRSHEWTGPRHAEMVHKLEDDLRVQRGNLSRLERDVHDWRSTHDDVMDRIVRELETISKNGAKEAPVIQKLQEFEDRVLDMEQVISALPCAEHMSLVARYKRDDKPDGPNAK